MKEKTSIIISSNKLDAKHAHIVSKKRLEWLFKKTHGLRIEPSKTRKREAYRPSFSSFYL